MDVITRLKEYQYDQYSTSISKNHFDELKSYEGNSPEEYTVYRGICVPSENELKYIIEKISSNKFSKRGGCQSFTLSKDIAEMFSTSEMSNFPTARITKAVELMESRFDHIAGYGSLIIKAKFSGKDCIDVDKILGSSESEILVKSDSVPISITYEIEKSHYEKG